MKIEIIPATDIIGGACVRLTQGDYGRRTTYYSDPLEAALRFEETGIRRLHMVDLDGAKAAQPRNLAVLERIASKTAAASKAPRRSAAYSTRVHAAPSAEASPYAGRSFSPDGSRNSGRES